MKCNLFYTGYHKREDIRFHYKPFEGKHEIYNAKFLRKEISLCNVNFQTSITFKTLHFFTFLFNFTK